MFSTFAPSVTRRCIFFIQKYKLCGTKFCSQTRYQTLDQRQTFRINQNSNKILKIVSHPFEPSPLNHSHQQQGWFHFSNENEVKIIHDDELWVFFPAIFFSRRVPGDAQLMLPRSNPIDEWTNRKLNYPI